MKSPTKVRRGPAKRPRKAPAALTTSPAFSAAAAPRWASWLEIAFAVVLAAAGLGSAWSSQQTRLWGGVQVEKYALATGLRSESARMHALADARLTIEIGLFSQWLNASASGDQRLAKIYHERFPPAFRPDFDAWLAQDPLNNPDAPRTPFDRPSMRRESARAAELGLKADTAFRDAQDANHVGDRFGQVNVIFATAMFIAGVGNQFDGRRVRLALMAVGFLCCAFGFARLLHLPALFAG